MLQRSVLLLLLLTGCTEQPPVPASHVSPDVAVQNETDTATEQTATPEPGTGASAKSDQITGKVVGVIDGDTIDILTDDKTTIRIRLNGIDAPEKGQPFGNTAKEFLSESIGGLDVRVVTHGEDRYGRVIGDVFGTEEIDGVKPISSVNVTMVINGLAWHYVKYAPDRKDLAYAETWARGKRLRLWSDNRHVAPWDWRKLNQKNGINCDESV